MGADVISSSLGYLAFDRPYTSYSDRDLDGETAISTKAANMAIARGVVVVNAAGNGGLSPVRNTLIAPADGKRVLAVGAVDLDGVRATFSSVGPTADDRIKPDVAALGVRNKVATSAGPSAYGLASGTSFSCPLTAGVVALLLQAHPAYTVDQVLFALRSTASRHDAPDNLLGWGILDAVAAVDVEVPKPQATAVLAVWSPSNKPPAMRITPTRRHLPDPPPGAWPVRSDPVMRPEAERTTRMRLRVRGGGSSRTEARHRTDRRSIRAETSDDSTCIDAPSCLPGRSSTP